MVVLLVVGSLVSGGWIPGYYPSQANPHQKAVFNYTTDKSVDVTIHLVYSGDNIPLYYTTRLQSPVCMEDLCNPIDIHIEWDLLGDFQAYKEISGNPITKFDHQPLSEADHEKLAGILANKESLLQDYKIEDLVDTTDLIYSKEIDGMTGATSKTFENDIVSGAVYTCYTLWNFVNGDIDTMMLSYTKSILSDSLLLEMIDSEKENYLNFILESEVGHYSTKVNSALGRLIWKGNPIYSVKAVSVVNDEYWTTDSIREMVSKRFLELKIPVQNALIRRFVNNQTSKAFLSIFLDLLPTLKESHRHQVYQMFKLNMGSLDEEFKRQLRRTFKSPEYRMTGQEYELLSILGIDY